MSSKTVGIVADASYLYSAKRILGGNVDYGHLITLAESLSGAEVGPAVVHIKDIPGQKRFTNSLKSAGYQYMARDWDSKSPGWIQEVALSILNVAPFVTHLVVAVGDFRLAPIIEFVQENWKVEVLAVGFAEDTSDDITESVSKFTELDSTILYSPQLRDTASA